MSTDDWTKIQTIATIISTIIGLVGLFVAIIVGWDRVKRTLSFIWQRLIIWQRFIITWTIKNRYLIITLLITVAAIYTAFSFTDSFWSIGFILGLVLIIFFLIKSHYLIEIAEHIQQITGLEKKSAEQEQLIKQMYRTQKSNSDIRNQLTIEKNELTRERDTLRDELHKQAESYEALTSARSHLISDHQLTIVSASFGIDASGGAIDDVTEQITLDLAHSGKSLVNLHLVGGKENDPLENTPKKLYLFYFQGQLRYKEFDEHYTLSIEDLIQNLKGNTPESRDVSDLRQKSRWKPPSPGL